MINIKWSLTKDVWNDDVYKNSCDKCCEDCDKFSSCNSACDENYLNCEDDCWHCYWVNKL